MKRPFWTPDALNDLGRLDDHYRNIDTDLAQKMAQAMFAAGRFLAENPRAGPFVADAPVRKWRVQRFPLLLLYRERNNTVEILRVRHARENWRDEA